MRLLGALGITPLAGFTGGFRILQLSPDAVESVAGALFIRLRGPAGPERPAESLQPQFDQPGLLVSAGNPPGGSGRPVEFISAAAQNLRAQRPQRPKLAVQVNTRPLIQLFRVFHCQTRPSVSLPLLKRFAQLDKCTRLSMKIHLIKAVKDFVKLNKQNVRAAQAHKYRVVIQTHAPFQRNMQIFRPPKNSNLPFIRRENFELFAPTFRSLLKHVL